MVENIDLKELSKNIRKKLLFMHCRARNGHIGSAFSIVEILTILYFRILRIDPKRPKNPDRDRFILSKGHACSAWYVVLAKRGYFDENVTDKYCIDGGILPEHPNRFSVPGIEASTGSLGHGLPIGLGIALAGKKDKRKYRVFVLMSDGECEEGSVWEAAISASRLKLDNLIGIIDANELQAYERTNNIQPISSLRYKFEDFGWSVKETNGHNFKELKEALTTVPLKEGKPTMIIAHTVKGKGIPTMEDKLEWHYRPPKESQLKSFIKTLEEVG